jgi:hypothetical protein
MLAAPDFACSAQTLVQPSLNPVEAGLARRAQDYVWSSDHYYRRERSPDWLDVGRVLPLLGPTKKIASARYRKLMREKVAEPYEDLQSHARAIKGDKAFAERVLREVGKSESRVRSLTENQVARAVAASLGMKPRELTTASRQRKESRARLIAAYLGRAIGGIPVSRTAKYFGREESTFVRGVLRLEEKLKTDANLRKLLARLSEALRAT